MNTAEMLGRAYQEAREGSNGAFVPQEVGSRFAELSQRATDDVVQKLSEPYVELYPDAAVFLDNLWHYPNIVPVIWTQGEMTEDLPDGTPYAVGFQQAKMLSCGLYDHLPVEYQDRTARIGLPSEMGGFDKNSDHILNTVRDAMHRNRIPDIHIIDDKVENLITAGTFFVENGCYTYLNHIDRTRLFDYDRVPDILKGSFASVSSLSQIHLPVDRRGVLLLDFDRTMGNIDDTLARMAEKLDEEV